MLQDWLAVCAPLMLPTEVPAGLHALLSREGIQCVRVFVSPQEPVCASFLCPPAALVVCEHHVACPVPCVVGASSSGTIRVEP